MPVLVQVCTECSPPLLVLCMCACACVCVCVCVCVQKGGGGVTVVLKFSSLNCTLHNPLLQSPTVLHTDYSIRNSTGGVVPCKV